MAGLATAGWRGGVNLAEAKEKGGKAPELLRGFYLFLSILASQNHFSTLNFTKIFGGLEEGIPAAWLRHTGTTLSSTCGHFLGGFGAFLGIKRGWVRGLLGSLEAF